MINNYSKQPYIKHHTIAYRLLKYLQEDSVWIRLGISSKLAHMPVFLSASWPSFLAKFSPIFVQVARCGVLCNRCLDTTVFLCSWWHFTVQVTGEADYDLNWYIDWSSRLAINRNWDKSTLIALACRGRVCVRVYTALCKFGRPCININYYDVVITK